MRRIAVVGSSGSGKTTIARRLAEALGYPYLELDAVFHRQGWADEPPADFTPTVSDFVNGERWVVDGDYSPHGMREIVWPAADTVVWLDMPRRTVMRRVALRTVRRLITRERLWNCLTESWSSIYSLDPQRSIIAWAWTSYTPARARYEACLEDGTWSHATVYRIRTRRQADSLTSQAAEFRRASGP